MIIFGWGHKKFKNYGGVYWGKCSNCKNEVLYELHEYQSWITLYFIPIIPESKKYFLMCPVCGYGCQLNYSNFCAYKEIIIFNRLVKQGSISKDDYISKLKSLGYDELQAARHTNTILEKGNEVYKTNISDQRDTNTNMNSNKDTLFNSISKTYYNNQGLFRVISSLIFVILSGFIVAVTGLSTVGIIVFIILFLSFIIFTIISELKHE